MISIIVDNYNRSYILPLLMQFYNYEKFEEAEVEMVIVDDGSRDGFLDWLKHGLEIIKPWFNVRAFRVPEGQTRKNVGRTLNIGVKQSLGDLLILNHSDVIPLNPQTLKIVWENHRLIEMLYLTPLFLTTEMLQEVGGAILPPGASLSKRLYEEVGGFDERFMGYGPVDVDFAQRIIYGQKERGWIHQKSHRLIFLHLKQAKIPRRGEPNPQNDEILLQNIQNKRWTVNPHGWGVCHGLEEIKL